VGGDPFHLQILVMAETIDALLTFEDVARLLGVSRRTVNRLVARRQLRMVTLGHCTKRFRPTDVERMKSKLSGEPLNEWT
jgi:excisionase family DNA binding protein